VVCGGVEVAAVDAEREIAYGADVLAAQI